MAFIKICGMTDGSAVEAALAAGVDAIGFVFAPSVRSVTPEYAAQLALPARGKVRCVAVTLHPDAALLTEIFTVFKPDVLQTDVNDLASIVLPSGVKSWPVLRGVPAGLLPASVDPQQPLLFEGPRSGTGKVADWSVARLLATSHRLILAGGLSPANVADAIDAVRPFGVDVSSGVEDSPGKKSPALIESFVSRAREAFVRTGSGEP
jgi:phosphoribosylanthranilate isomerase